MPALSNGRPEGSPEKSHEIVMYWVLEVLPLVMRYLLRFQRRRYDDRVVFRPFERTPEGSLEKFHEVVMFWVLEVLPLVMRYLLRFQRRRYDG